MKNFKVLGIGCANCKNTAKLIQEIAAAKSVEINLEKIEDMQEILTYKLMATPGVVMDGEIVHSGGVPSKSKVESWF
jgi:small redox-active disulfide protein 2